MPSISALPISGAAQGAIFFLLYKLAGRRRPAEMEALKLGTAKLPHYIGLLGCFDPFSGRLDTEAAGQGENGVDDSNAILGTLRCAADEGLVDFDLGEMGAAQIAEGAVALAEIVEHKPDPESTEPFERGQGRGVIPE